MPIKKRQDLYDLFATGNKPTHNDFVDLVDSMINIAEDGIGISEKGKPMELIIQGNDKRLLDFASSKDTPIWRINAQSTDGNRNGLNISSSNRSRLFVRQDNGFIGVNNDAPTAKVHITPDSGPALRVDDVTKQASFVIAADGGVGIGTDIQDEYKLSVDGKVNLKGETLIEGPVHAEDGIIVHGAKLTSEQGLNVLNGATIESGLLEAQDGLTVSGPLTARSGAIVSGLPLEVENGLVINQGATVETGMLSANAGLTVSGATLSANAGLTVSGATLIANAGAVVNGALLTANNGFTVSNGPTNINGELFSNGGLTVNNSALEANGQVFLGNSDNGKVTVNGEFIAKKGIVLEDPSLRAAQGIEITEGDLAVDHSLSVNGELAANGGLSVNNSALQATGHVVLGNSDNGDILVEGVLEAHKGIVVKNTNLQAQAGAVVTGSELQVENGLHVKNGAIIETGLLSVKDGMSIDNGSAFSATGIVNLGNTENGEVTINGELRAVNGGVISGATLQVQSGLSVAGNLNAFGESNLDTASIQTLNVTDVNVTGNLGLTSIDLASLNAESANIKDMNTEGDLNVYGKCKVVDDVVLACGRILASYEGIETDSPKIRITEGTVSGRTGHFDFEIDENKLVTITFDNLSDINNFMNDWRIYRDTHADQTEGFDFQRVGLGSGRLKEEEIEFVPTATVYKEYRIPTNGVKIMYTGTQPGTPQFAIQRNTEDLNSNRFDFLVQDLSLGILFPNDLQDRTVNNLLNWWADWKNLNQDLAADFEIRQTGDRDWRLNDLLEVEELVSTEDVVREFNIGELTISNSSNKQNRPGIIIAAATPSSEEDVGIDASLDTIIITLGTMGNTPQAVFKAWNDLVEDGNETYGFEIAETNDTTPIRLSQQGNLVMIDETHSRIEVAGIAVTYTGDEAGLAKVLLQEGSEDGFSFSIDDLNKEITINYPANVDERTVAGLLSAWEGITDKYGFEISGLGEEILVRQEEIMDTIIGEIKEYVPVTQGVDNITIRYIGPETDTPGVIIQSNNANDFAVSINEDKVMTIKYPQDKSGTIDELIVYWEGLTAVERDGFSLIKYAIENAIVDEVRADLVVNEENKIFSRGLIRTNSVTINGNLKFEDSGIEISAISNNEALAEDSDALLSTQKAIKSYVDNGLALKADADFVIEELTLKANQSFVAEELGKKADQTYVDSGLAEKVDQSFVTEELEKKADQNFVTEELTKKADQTYVDNELAEKVDQSFVTEELEKKADQNFVTEELTKKADQTYVDSELVEKADLSVMTTALASKANLLKPEDLSLGQGTTAIVNNLDLTADCRGVLMVRFTAVDSAGAGLFAVHGVDSLIKIAGDGMSDIKDNVDTWNVYTDGGVVTLQNTTAVDVTAKVTYFGG